MDLEKREGVQAPSDDSSRPERRLGRGLEDVSYLFLSQPSGRSLQKTAEEGVAVVQPSSEPPPSRMPMLLRAYPSFNREMLISLLSYDAAVLEDGLCAIDTNVPCNPLGVIDLLAVDESNRLTIINIDSTPNDESFLRGIACFDWIARNRPIVKRLCREHKINDSIPPKLFLIAPDFSPLLRCAVQRTSNPGICCFIYRTAAISGGAGILFEPVFLWSPPPDGIR
jgi:hypothetical protein